MDAVLNDIIEAQIQTLDVQEQTKKEPIMPQEIKLNKIELLISKEPIEIVNLSNGMTSSILVNGRVRTSNTNMYRIPITSNYTMDDFYTIKHYTKFAEFIRIVSIRNGIASIIPLISGVELKTGDVIGELI
jgi:hypothetical protein